MARLSYKQQVQRVREDAIVEAVNREYTTESVAVPIVPAVSVEGLPLTSRRGWSVTVTSMLCI